MREPPSESEAWNLFFSDRGGQSCKQTLCELHYLSSLPSWLCFSCKCTTYHTTFIQVTFYSYEVHESCFSSSQLITRHSYWQPATPIAEIGSATTSLNMYEREHLSAAVLECRIPHSVWPWPLAVAGLVHWTITSPFIHTVPRWAAPLPFGVRFPV